jgi:hypothetical protein
LLASRLSETVITATFKATNSPVGLPMAVTPVFSRQ